MRAYLAVPGDCLIRPKTREEEAESLSGLAKESRLRSLFLAAVVSLRFLLSGYGVRYNEAEIKNNADLGFHTEESSLTHWDGMFFTPSRADCQSLIYSI